MAAIEPSDLAVIRRYWGRISPAEQPEFEERLDRLGEPLLAALEALEERLGTIARGPGRVGSDGDSASFRETVEWLRGQVVKCIGAIDASELQLSTDEAAWVDGLRASEDEVTRTIPMVAVMPRRG